MPIKMIFKSARPYGGRRVAAGQAVTVPGQSDARLLSALGWASVAPADPPPPVAEELPADKPADERPESPVEKSEAAEDDADGAAPKGKRQYRRRDMTADS